MTVARGAAAELSREIDKAVPRLHIRTQDFADALETMNRGAGFPAGAEVSPALAVECWRLVQYVRELPGELPERCRV